MKVSTVRNDDHVGISSFVFSNTGKGTNECESKFVWTSGFGLGLYMSSCSELQEISVSAADGCSSMGGRIPLKPLGRDSDRLTSHTLTDFNQYNYFIFSQIFRENEVIERSSEISCATTVQLWVFQFFYFYQSWSTMILQTFQFEMFSGCQLMGRIRKWARLSILKRAMTLT